MKECSKCGVLKPHDLFQKRAASTDGLTASCKDCLKERDSKRNSSEKRRKMRRDYAATPEGKLKCNAAKAAYIEKNPKIRAAHILVGNYIRDGKLLKVYCCENCNAGGKVEAHHSDYNKPLEILWLCDKCHKDWHKHNTPIV